MAAILRLSGQGLEEPFLHSKELGLFPSVKEKNWGGEYLCVWKDHAGVEVFDSET